MSEKPNIQKLLATVLLVLFTISFIPKAYFHDVIASHTDTVADCQHPDKTQACVRQQGFKCGFTDLVVASPYLSIDNTFNLIRHSAYSSFTERFYFINLQQYCFGKESRGPPSLTV